QFIVYGSQSHGQMRRIELPPEYPAGSPNIPIAVHNVRRVYHDLAEAIHTGVEVEPSFKNGWQVHRLLDTIERAARSGKRQRLDD
ncbi:hypothetical protein UK99_22160, partial [Frankia casuarinae]